MLLAVMTVGLSAVFTSCSSDDDEEKQTVDVTPISVYAGNSQTISMNYTPKRISSQNDFIATVDNSGKIQGIHVGSTNISVDGKYIIPVEVKGKRETYGEPVTKWGCNQYYIQEHQKHKGTLSLNGGNLGYKECGKAEGIVYIMEDNKLAAVGVGLKSIYASEIGEYLAERYLMSPYSIEDYTFIGMDAYKLEDANTVVLVKTVSASWIFVLYMPAAKADTRSAFPMFELNETEKVITNNLFL